MFHLNEFWGETTAMIRIIGLLFLSLLFASSVQAKSTRFATAEPPFQQVAVMYDVAAPGQEQTLAITLDQPGGFVTIFRLVVTYANGATQDVLDETMSNNTTISWVVPADAGAGVARYRLSTSGCGCGDRSRPASPVNTESSAEGVFFVSNGSNQR